MSKKLKALICVFTACVMLAASTGINVFAADTNEDGSGKETVIAADGSEAVATEIPETFNGADVDENEADAARLEDESAAQATEEPEATPVPKTYDGDAYYRRSLQVCSALGIITGYDDGSIKPESTVTRAEMATIILRMIAVAGDSTYRDVFTDVSSAHWAANTIQTSVEQGIVDGMGDGTFVPDGSVKYEQVIKMIVCAMNYGIDAENAGGYPAGYLSVGGSTLKLLTGVSGAAGEDMPRGEVIKAVYNALLAAYRDIKEFKNGYPVYETKDTLGVEKFDMYEGTGVLTTTPNLTIAAGSTTKDGMITIDGVDYKCDFNVDEYVATKVKFYYIDDKNDDDKVIAMFSTDRSQDKTFKDKEIESIDMTGGVIKVYTSEKSSNTKRYDIKNAAVIYNGTMMNTADYNKFKTSQYFKSVYTGTKRDGSYSDFITPSVGTVRIVDYDNDGTYDIMFVDAYDTMLVTNSTSEKLTGKINNANVTIEYDLDDSSYDIAVTKNDTAASVKNLRKNDVASIKRNLDGTRIGIVVVSDSITGSVTATGTEDDEMTVTVNGQGYRVDVNATTDLKTGVSGTFYFDQFDRVGYVDLQGALSEGENYAMITRVFYDDEQELVIRLFTQEGKEIEVKPANNLSVWLPGATSSTTKPSESALYSALNDNDKYVKCVTAADSSGNPTAYYPIKLCSYKLNANGELVKLYAAVGTSTTSNTNALTIYDENGSRKANLRGVGAVGGALKGYTIEDGIVEFNVPDSESERGNGANYGAGTVTASGYKNYEGVSRDFSIGSFVNSRYPRVLVTFQTSATSVAKIGDVDTASIQPSMIVSKIAEAVDDEGETVFKVTGYSAGSEVSYMTSSNTGLYKFTGFNSSDRTYTGTQLYDATSDAPGKFTSGLSAGDIVVIKAVSGEAGVIIKMVEADDVAKMAVKGSASGLIETPAGRSASGSTRETFYMGFVADVKVEDSAFIDLRNYAGTDSGSVSYSSSAVFSDATITVDSSGNVTNVKVDKNGGIEPSELIPYKSGETEFDYAVFTGLKGGMNNGYIIRVQLDIAE